MGTQISQAWGQDISSKKLMFPFREKISLMNDHMLPFADQRASDCRRALMVPVKNSVLQRPLQLAFFCSDTHIPCPFEL